MTPEEALARIAALRNKPGASLIHAVAIAEAACNNSEPDRAESGMAGNVGTKECDECGRQLTYDEHDPKFLFHEWNGSQRCDLDPEAGSEDIITITISREDAQAFATEADSSRDLNAKVHASMRVSEACRAALEGEK